MYLLKHTPRPTLSKAPLNKVGLSAIVFENDVIDLRALFPEIYQDIYQENLENLYQWEILQDTKSYPLETTKETPQLSNIIGELDAIIARTIIDGMKVSIVYLPIGVIVAFDTTEDTNQVDYMSILYTFSGIATQYLYHAGVNNLKSLGLQFFNDICLNANPEPNLNPGNIKALMPKPISFGGETCTQETYDYSTNKDSSTYNICTVTKASLGDTPYQIDVITQYPTRNGEKFTSLNLSIDIDVKVNASDALTIEPEDFYDHFINMKEVANAAFFSQLPANLIDDMC